MEQPALLKAKSELPEKSKIILPDDENITLIKDRFKKLRSDDVSQNKLFKTEQLESHIIAKLRLNLEEQGVADHLIRQIIKNITSEVKNLDSITKEDIKNVFSRIIEDKVSIAKAIDRHNGKPYLVAFVGPTGVGKTTTIAKLSAKYALENKNSIALISLDCQRVGATVTLEKYAGIIGLPYKTVSSEEELRQSIKLFQNSRYIFIDTPGLAISDTEKINQLSIQLNGIAPDEIHLLLSAVTKDQDMAQLCRTYTPCKVNRLIFTKIDETFGIGNLLNLIEKRKISLSYLTNGQCIPEDIINASTDVITDLLINSSNSYNRAERRLFSNKDMRDNSQLMSLPEGDYYIANKNSDIFHHRNCKSVERINLNNVIIFQNILDAQKQNFKPCRMCCLEKTRNNRLMQRFRHKIAVSR
jgi:flagellar biosynthesis protein FlhF